MEEVQYGVRLVQRGIVMFSWTRTFYAKKDGIYYNFDMKRQRDDAVKNHGMEIVSAAEAYKHYRKVIQIPWEQYEERIKYI